MNTVNYLFWGYNAIWIILGVYLFILLRRMSQLESRVARLRDRLERGPSS